MYWNIPALNLLKPVARPLMRQFLGQDRDVLQIAQRGLDRLGRDPGPFQGPIGRAQHRADGLAETRGIRLDILAALFPKLADALQQLRPTRLPPARRGREA